MNNTAGCFSNSNTTDSVFTYIGNVIDNPELRCLNVNTNGTIQLSWQTPNPSSWINFNQYNIYRNNGSGFVLRDSIDPYTANTYTDATANGNAGSVAYYLVTKSGCTGQVDTSSLTTTLNSLYLKVSGAGNNIATLNWNALKVPALTTADPGYKIEREFPGGSGNWSVLNNSFVGTSYTENLDSICIDSVNFRVSTGDGLPCTSGSNVDGEIFVDNSIPAAPILKCASVLANGDVTLTWIAPTDTAHQFNSYHIYSASSINGPYTDVDSIFNYGTVITTINGTNAQANPIYFSIKTRSGCGAQYSPGSDTLKTIKVNVQNNNGVAVITWNPLTPYVAGSNTSFDVYKEYPAGIWSFLANVPEPVYQYLDTINVCQAVINYRVETGDPNVCRSVSSIDGDLFHDLTKTLCCPSRYCKS